MMRAVTRRGGLIGLAALVTMVSALWMSPGADAQQQRSACYPILTIDSERLFAETAFGRRIADEIEEAGRVLAAENRRIEAELTEEEQDLTEKRAEMSSEDFREVASAFDEKVQSIRRQQEVKARALVEKSDAGRVAFLRAAQPVLGQIMQEAGASVILERSSVFFSSNASDITELAVSRIDAAIGDGLADMGEERP